MSHVPTSSDETLIRVVVVQQYCFELPSLRFAAEIFAELLSRCVLKELLLLIAVWNRMVLNVLHCLQKLEGVTSIQLFSCVANLVQALKIRRKLDAFFD